MALDAKIKTRVVLTSLLYIAAVGLTWFAVRYPCNGTPPTWLALFAMAWLAEADRVPIPQLKVHLTLSFAMFIAALMIVGPIVAAALAAAAAAVEAVRRHYPPLNFAFNVGQIYVSALATGVGVAAVGQVPIRGDSLGFLAVIVFVASIVALLTNATLVAAFLATRSPSFWPGFRSTLKVDVRWTLLSYAITSTLGLLMYYVYLTPLGLAGIALLLLALVAVRFTARQNAELREAHIETMRILSDVLDARDHYTHGHSARVAELAKAIAAAKGLPEPDQQIIESAGLLHDIGKMTIGDDILFKDGALTDEEFARMREHPERGAQMIRPIGYLRLVQEIVRYHHERFDGRGYPHGLSGTHIPIGARILSVADAWDAMTIERAYRPAYSPDQAVRQLLAGKGTQFDPDVVEVFLKQVLPARGIRVVTGDDPVVSKACPVEEGTTG